MGEGYRRYNNPIEELGAQIRELSDRIRGLEAKSTPFKIPVVSTDPPETDPTNLWMLPDGRLRGRHLNVAGTAYTYREWVATAPGTGTSANAPAPPPPAPVTQQTISPAIWSRSFRENGNQRTDQGVVNVYYGSSGDGFNGRNRSLIGFDYAAIASTLSGSTILDVKLTMYNLHAYLNSGVDIYFGIHNFSALPGTWAGGGIPRSMIAHQHFGKPQLRTIQLPLEFAQAIRDGWGKGIALEAPSSSTTYYGYAAGVGSGQTVPTLTITYAK
jgi:hypothetical protein